MEGKKVKAHSDLNLSSRRDFMKTAGKLAIYTPPAIMLLMHPNRQAIAKSYNPCRPTGKPVGTSQEWHNGPAQIWNSGPNQIFNNGPSHGKHKGWGKS
jgi:hypothetical protein